MKFTKREKVLLLTLALVIILYGYFQFIIGPQFRRINQYRESIALYQSEINKNDSILSSKDAVDNEYEKINIDIRLMGKELFSSLKQGYLIVLLNDLIDHAEIEVSSIAFSNIREEKMAETTVNAISVTLPFEGSYLSLLNFLKEIREYEKKIIVQKLNIDSSNNDLLTGSISLDFYSVSDKIGNDDSLSAFLDDKEINENPFSPFDGYEDASYGEWDEENNFEQVDTNTSVKIALGPSKVILNEFEGLTAHFKGSSPQVSGRVALDTNGKQGNYAARLEYDFSRENSNKTASLVFENAIVLSKSPHKLGIWVYAFENADHSINIEIKDSKRKTHKIPLASSINWIGWKYVTVDMESKLPYPITIERLSVESTDAYEHKGQTLLFDKLEAIYQMSVPGKNEMTYSNQNDMDYNKYEVQNGDTLFSISKAFYNDYTKRNLIMESNNISDPGYLFAGQVLLIPKLEEGIGYTSSNNQSNVENTTDNREPTKYVVKSGDTLFNISKQFYQDYSKRNLIIDYNNLQSPYSIKVGQVLYIPQT